MMKFAVVLTIGLTFGVPTESGAQQVPQQGTPAPAAETLVGVYECQGVNPDGTTYQGVVEITQLGGTFRVLWTLSDQSQVLGVGILSNGVFAVSYWGGAPAIVVYKIDGNRLVGEWTMGGKEGQMYSETLTKVEGDHPLLTVPPDPSPSPQRRLESKPKLSGLSI